MEHAAQAAMTLAQLDLGFFLKNVWLIPLFPLVSFLLVGLFIRPLCAKTAGIVATLAVFASAVCAYGVAYEYFTLFPPGGAHPAIVPFSWDWLRYQENFSVTAGVLVDPISVMLMVVVTTVSTLVHLYSTGYMHGEAGYGRYFTWLNLFTFSMLGLVVSPNILQMYVCWELVGASSFLLIGFYFEKPSAVSASKKAFIVTRFADLGFLIGVILLGYYGFNFFGEVAPAITSAGNVISGSPLQPFDFAFLNSPEALAKMTGMAGTFMGMSLLTLAICLVYMGAAGKSAMFPLHIWLPDAMEGPTPVSALIHAATMVVAGVYLVARLFPVFAASGDALMVVMYIGAFTALFAAVIGCTQDDIKRVLAFSTLSQLGYMMFALGVATMDQPLGYTASMFHLFTHAFFKALLFLGAGALIHAVHSNEIWDMGGLRKKMPITHITMLIATLAIAGIWPFAGFFSKDEILVAALENQHYGVFALGLAVAGITAFYMFRIYFVAFWGKPRNHKADHAHEAPAVMLIPLCILAVLSVSAGWLPMASFVSIGHGHGGGHHGINWAVAGPSLVVAAIGIFTAWFMYGTGNDARSNAVANGLGGVYRTIKKKFYFDEIYLFVTHKIIFRFVATPVAWFDRNVVDGGVNLTGWASRASGALLGRFQTGQVQTYGVWYVVGSVLLLVFLWATLV